MRPGSTGLRHFLSYQVPTVFCTRGVAHCKFLPMPKLSPTMTSGRVEKWYVVPKDLVRSYQLVLEISTVELTQSARDRKNYDAEVSLMEIEILEDDMYVAKLIATEGQEIKSGAPIAVLCEHSEDIPSVAAAKVTRFYDSI